MLRRLHRILRDLFSIDARCLGVLRIALALLLLTDLLLRSRFISETCTDDGLLPRDFVPAPACWMSLQMLDGSLAFQLVHFLVAGLSSLMLLIGFQTRTATILCWILTISLHARNEFILDAGDDLLRSLLFWSVFLPLGARYSLDSRRQRTAATLIVLSPATAALLLQFASVYFTAGWFKTDPAWTDGTAIEYALGQTQWILPPGEFLRQYPAVLKLLTPAVVWFEIIAPVLLFMPFRTRTFRMMVIPAFWFFQAGLATCISLHIFPLIAAVGTIPFLSSVIWPNRPARMPDNVERRDNSARNIRGNSVALRTGLLATLATSIIWFQAANFGKSLLPVQERVLSLIGWNVIWSMYSNLPRDKFQFSAEATLQDNSRVDLVNSEVTTMERRRLQQFHLSYRNRYFLQTASAAFPEMPTYYLTCLVFHWNQCHAPERWVVRGKIAVTTEPIGTAGPAQTRILLDTGFSPVPGEQAQ